MIKSLIRIAIGILILIASSQCTASAGQAQSGSIRGTVYDADFDAPLAAVKVTVVELDRTVDTTDLGNYIFNEVPAGVYTLTFAKTDFEQQIKTDVAVSAGKLTDVNVYMPGTFIEMEEFIVEDALQMGSGTEAALLQLRMESPALMDSISSDLMSRAGASDAAGALRLVTGATVKDGKFAVIRGLPDRYVSSQLDSVRLPSADEDTRSVELDQFPSAVIESIQVSKTFTPDQQGDASGGAVNVVLKGIPDDPFLFEFKSQIGYNSNVRNRSDFLSYNGGGVNFWGKDDGSKDIPPYVDPDADPSDPLYLVRDFRGAAGVETRAAPTDYKLSTALGMKHEFESGLKIGALASYFYERDSAYHDDGIDDSFWVETPGGPLVPKTSQGTPTGGDFKTSLFDLTNSTESVQWGGLLTGGLEYEDQLLELTYLYTRTTEDVTTLAEDTRGKQWYFADYDPNDIEHPNNGQEYLDDAPYLRTETLEYTERKVESVILSGDHKLPIEIEGWGDTITFLEPQFDWTLSKSSADMYQPDKRLLGALWWPESVNPGTPPYVPPSIDPARWFPFKPDALFSLGNFQRIYKEIEEDSKQYSLNLKLPFEQWDTEEGYLKFGMFKDKVDRKFNQDSFGNFNETGVVWEGEWDDYWSTVFPYDGHDISDSTIDVDYDGEQKISAWYTMLDLPLTSYFSLIGGVRYEDTDIGIVNFPEEDASWYPKNEPTGVNLNPGDADVNYNEDSALPSIGFEIEPWNELTFRGAYSETVARQTFKELTPIMHQEYLGGPIFIGNPDLQMADVQNYDLRLDWRPYEGGLVSVSWFYKDLENPIEYVQRLRDFSFTTAENYPKGELRGYEFEVRQDLGRFYSPLNGLAVGGNATLIHSEVTLPDEDAAEFLKPGIEAPHFKREATGAPEHLYNTYLTYDVDLTKTQFGLFWTVTGDTLVAGAGPDKDLLVPNVYAKEYGTINFSLTQKLGDYIKLKFQAKNINNPEIKTVYRSNYLPGEKTKTSYTKGIDYSIQLSVGFRF